MTISLVARKSVQEKEKDTIIFTNRAVLLMMNKLLLSCVKSADNITEN